MEVDDTYVRSKDEINETIKLANIDDSELKRVSQVLLPEKSLNSSCYRLIEVDKKLLKALEEGTSLSFRGQKNHCAVLCTDTSTYEIKEAETSNSLLLVPNIKFGNDIERICSKETPEDRILEEIYIRGQFNTYYELKQCKPNISDLLTLLEPSCFNGSEYERNIDPDTLCDWGKIRNNTQASDGEIQEALSKHLVVVLNGYYRLISFQCEARSVALMLDVMDSNSWEPEEVNMEITYESLKELIPREIFNVLVQKYAEPSGKSTEDGSGTPLYRYDEERCCKLSAQILLSASPSTEYTKFMEAWKLAIPDNMKPIDKYLNGIALIIWNKKRMRKEIVSYPESHLPENIVPRLNELFKRKEKWTVDEIAPYISRCTTADADVNALLTKYTRPSIVNGIKYYSSKHGR